MNINIKQAEKLNQEQSYMVLNYVLSYIKNHYKKVKDERGHKRGKRWTTITYSRTDGFTVAVYRSFWGAFTGIMIDPGKGILPGKRNKKSK